jgi:phospholipid/cholesterol/gamma-HCH transport system substrate-binding protein
MIWKRREGPFSGGEGETSDATATGGAGPATSLIARIVALAAVTVGVAALVIVLLARGSSYTVHAIFQNASQLVKGDQVQVAGVPMGKVSGLRLTPDGQAEVTLQITDGSFRPLREGTLATVRQASLSGVANRYVDLRLPPATAHAIRNGGTIPATSTASAVDLDQLFNLFDQRTRRSLSGVIRGFSTLYGGRSVDLSRAYLYLNPSLAATTRLFDELNHDTPLFERFVVASSKLVTDLASRRGDLSGLVANLATTTGAIARQKQDLADAIAQLPAFMRRANTTFVNLRHTLGDLTPLVNESKPVARRLQPFIDELRPLTHDARPTLRNLARLIRDPRTHQDLITLTQTTVPLRDIAVGPVQANGKQRPGAFPASTDALNGATPETAFGRPYLPDVTSWFNSFSHSGPYDALGGLARAAPFTNAFALVNGMLQPVPPNLRPQEFLSVATLGQRNRCPGSIERNPGDNSTPYHPPGFPCDPTQVPPGP